MAETGASPDPVPHPDTALPPVARAEHFVWLTARVLEQRRFAHHFAAGVSGGDGRQTADAVEAALTAYGTPDGGFGHGLEPDLRGPVSQPLHAGHALRVLDSIGRCGGQRADRVCRYLTSVSTPEGALPAIHPSQRGYPSAPFVPVVDDPPGELLATGPVVGLLHRNDVWHAWLFRATDFCWAAVESLEKTHPYEVQAAVAFLDGVPDRPRARAAADRLGRLVREQRLAALDPSDLDAYPVAAGYAPGEHHFAHDFARTPESLARAWFTDDEMRSSLDFLEREQQEDGGWPVRWRQWAPGPALESRPIVTIEALLTLRAHGRDIG
ncbi:hypothetical protein DCW30_28315 [Streptomyces alfalfae]|uniref:Prenyltransferase n=1 Tax=Streptomyces alfalfae TaxID=1642299 RepID=A0ABM6GQD7_9ACTN|nr:hypothetical protein [Streptomyces alfalfae]AYA16407.1 hypothetical protein D3X13_09395 [Streptomyces fradiae]APY86038.1 hypothetical protein A7J05_10225 [Streptomyces alfalfae]QUI34239.1 hypothetical protein H9W91_27845 [Streptomyces alfalfae]RXX38394.1 hypothetical protein DCW30_28315 [Streptomyces alfalfae]RZM98439.1 hypothetical protein D4104_12310 [Streptomyces alfalfae]